LFGVRGRSARTLGPARRQVNYIGSRKREHSRKPDEQYALIESCSPGPYLELFARGVRPGWATWGEEARDGWRPGWKTHQAVRNTSTTSLRTRAAREAIQSLQGVADSGSLRCGRDDDS
jgi:hypothetical protein